MYNMSFGSEALERIYTRYPEWRSLPVERRERSSQYPYEQTVLRIPSPFAHETELHLVFEAREVMLGFGDWHTHLGPVVTAEETERALAEMNDRITAILEERAISCARWDETRLIAASLEGLDQLPQLLSAPGHVLRSWKGTFHRDR